MLSVVRTRAIPNIMFVGPQDPEALARWYSVADVFVFPSLVDVWGLVVNEAMACGLPVLASKYAGASQELVRDGEWGSCLIPMTSRPSRRCSNVGAGVMCLSIKNAYSPAWTGSTSMFPWPHSARFCGNARG